MDQLVPNHRAKKVDGSSRFSSRLVLWVPENHDKFWFSIHLSKRYIFFLFSLCFLLTILCVPACLYLQASVSQPYLSRCSKDESTVGFLPFPISWNYFAEHDFMQFVSWNPWIFWVCFFKPTPPHLTLRVTAWSHCSHLAISHISLETFHNSERAWGPNLRTCEKNLSTGLVFTRVMWIEAAGQEANMWQHLDKMVPDYPEQLCIIGFRFQQN